MNSETHANVDPTEVEKFEKAAQRWWDTSSEFRPLHEINPLRANFIDSHSAVSGASVIDIGCGGGILSEELASRGAIVTGIDMGETPLGVAQLHAAESGVEVEYIKTTAEQISDERPEQYDIVTCLEMLEHVPNPASVVQACAKLCKPGGHLYFATINRNPKSYLLAVVAAEYIMQMLPKGTHDYEKFIKPSELHNFIRDAGLVLQDSTGMRYNPLTGTYKMVAKDLDVNYMLHAVRPD